MRVMNADGGWIWREGEGVEEREEREWNGVLTKECASGEGVVWS